MRERPELIRRLIETDRTADLDPTALQGTLMRGMQFARLLYHAFAERKPVAWINVFMPPELIFGCGYIPFWLDGIGGFSGWMAMTDVFDGAGSVLPANDLCTFLRAATGGITRGLFPQPRAVICTSHLCEAAPKVAEFGARRSHAEFHVVDVPSGLPEQLSEHTIEYVAKQLEQVAGRLCELSGSRLDIDKLREAVDFSNQARKCFSEVYKMRAQVPSPVTGSQFVGMGLMYPWGTKIGVAIAETLRSEIAARIAGGITAIPGGEKHRLMWLHLRPYFETNIMAVMERERRAVIVVDLLGEAYWPELDAQDPFRALAIRILSNPQLAPVAARTKRAVRLAREYRVDGVVHFLHWGCRWNYGQTSLFRNAMAREGAPFLALDGDAVDKRATPSGQLLTRLEGFLELLEHSSPQRDCR